jgi:plasmid stabilization system protein ParE
MEIIWSNRARITFFKVLDYLEKNWSQKEIIQFYYRTEIILRAINRNPGIFPVSHRYKQVRRALIDKNNSFFYQVDNYTNKIYLLTFFDNRQNPKHLKIN